ncbi:MAG: hypothetical protein A2289_16865 [Deltaproteobacteria bacterium RIFOXYA12_FULL_58_15]|nr:MAG: hypothetical protein A2289_16865 [Deltaproteobacteria bacterium RIFOXYA12_FULL_58_15]OGR10302.1 MAG: hypothetical protein A2341_16895 [Deltaproteobacteria bacterium RIFOXYB12_FULL_58_9]
MAWGAECRLGGLNAQGVLRDITDEGAFFTTTFTPQTAVESSGELAFLEEGDTIVLLYQPDWSGRALSGLAVVRWLGFSHEHGVDGVGVKFEAS